MKSELLKKALMATYDKGGKVKPPKKVKSEKELPAGGVWETDADGKKVYVIKSKGGTKGDSGRTYVNTNSGTKRVAAKSDPTKWKKEPTKSETEEKYYLEEPVTKTPEPTAEPFDLAFGWRGEKKETTGQGASASLPKIMVDGKPVKIREWSVPGVIDAKTGTWNTAYGAAQPTTVYAYEQNGKLVPIDVSQSKLNEQGMYDATNIVSPPSYSSKLIDKGSLTAKDSEMTRQIDAANEQQRKNYIGTNQVAPAVKVKQSISPTNFNESGYSIGKDVDINTVKESIIPTQMINAQVVGQNEDKLKPLVHPKFKKGGIVGKYATVGPIANPYVNSDILKGVKDIYGQSETSTEGNPSDAPLGPNSKNFMGGTKFKNMTSNQKSQLMGLASLGTDAIATGIDAADRKDDNSSIGGQAASGGIRYGGKGLALGMNPALMAATGGLSAPVGAGLGAAYGLYKGTKNAIKEDKEYNQVGTDMIRENAQNSLTYDPNAVDTFKGQNRKQEGKGLKKLFGFAKGGTIKGEGTGTSDSIETKVGGKGIPEGSFITPAKNNGLAKLIRRDVLGDNPNKVAGFKKGGDTNMAVSNGEHLFTPKEKQKITSYLGQEILEKLAPDAEENEDKACGGIAKKYGNGGKVKGNTTRRMYSTGNPSLDAEIDQLYKTGNWRKEAVDAIENKAKSLGIDTGESFLNPSSRSGVFKDLKTKSDYFTKEVDKSARQSYEQNKIQKLRSEIVPKAPKGLSENDMQTYNKLKNEVVVGGKDLAPLQKFVAAKKDSLAESNQFQGQLKRGIETGKEYAKKYQLAQDLKARLEYAKKNTDKFTAQELEKIKNEEKQANLEYSKLKTPSQYAGPNSKRLDAIYEEFAKKRYKPTKVEERQSAPVIQQKVVPVVKEQVKVTDPSGQVIDSSYKQIYNF